MDGDDDECVCDLDEHSLCGLYHYYMKNIVLVSVLMNILCVYTYQVYFTNDVSAGEIILLPF